MIKKDDQAEIIIRASAMKVKATADEIVNAVLDIVREKPEYRDVKLDTAAFFKAEGEIMIKLLETVDFMNERMMSLASIIQARKEKDGGAKA
jgi:hypothetical protein